MGRGRQANGAAKSGVEDVPQATTESTQGTAAAMPASSIKRRVVEVKRTRVKKSIGTPATGGASTGVKKRKSNKPKKHALLEDDMAGPSEPMQLEVVGTAVYPSFLIPQHSIREVPVSSPAGPQADGASTPSLLNEAAAMVSEVSKAAVEGTAQAVSRGKSVAKRVAHDPKVSELSKAATEGAAQAVSKGKSVATRVAHEANRVAHDPKVAELSTAAAEGTAQAVSRGKAVAKRAARDAKLGIKKTANTKRGRAAKSQLAKVQRVSKTWTDSIVDAITAPFSFVSNTFRKITGSA